MREESVSIRRDFLHNLSAGETREDVVGKFLSKHLPHRFKVSRGFVFSSDGSFSKQADLLLVDAQNNAPLYGGGPHELWPVESVFAFFEVKTKLDPDSLRDALAKCEAFKRLRRNFHAASGHAIGDSLFVLWAFECASDDAVAKMFEAELGRIRPEERPDLIVVPDRLIVRSGQLLYLALFGQPGSQHRAAIVAKFGANFSDARGDEQLELCGENSLLLWYIYLDSWLRLCGTRKCDPLLYLPPEYPWGVFRQLRVLAP